jgi:hypothetical protein
MNWRERRWYHVVIPSHTRKGEHTPSSPSAGGVKGRLEASRDLGGGRCY